MKICGFYSPAGRLALCLSPKEAKNPAEEILLRLIRIFLKIATVFRTRRSCRNLSYHCPPVLAERRCGLLAVVPYEFPIRVYLKSRLLTVRFDEDLVVPFAIGIVFP